MKTKLHATVKLPKTKSLFIHEADDVFTGWIDSDFKNFGLSEKTSKSDAMDMSVMILTENGTFKQIFESFRVPLDSLVVTQGQVIEFAKTIDLSEPYDYFFLLKKNEEFFVADAYVSERRLKAHVHRFSYDDVWRAGGTRRIVVPQLALGTEKVSDALTLERAIQVCKENGLLVFEAK